MLIGAGVAERVIYGGQDWEPFVRSLRRGDEAVIADLRVFGSRKRLGGATAQIEARGAVLVAAASGVRIDPPTLREAHEAERKWAGERSMGGSKRARALSARGIAAYRAKIKAGRMRDTEAVHIWRNVESYPNRADALKAMPGWSMMTAWRAFGAREPVRRK